jgi:hypothetical protein
MHGRSSRGDWNATTGGVQQPWKTGGKTCDGLQTSVLTLLPQVGNDPLVSHGEGKGIQLV